MAEETRKDRAKKMIFRLLKAAILSLIFYLITQFLSSLLSPFLDLLPAYRPLTDIFAVVFILLLFASELAHGTVLRYIFGFTRTFVFIIYLIYVLNGGALNLAVPVNGTPLNLLVDVRVFLMMLIFVLILHLSKNTLQAIEFLSKKTTKVNSAETLPAIEA